MSGESSDSVIRRTTRVTGLIEDVVVREGQTRRRPKPSLWRRQQGDVLKYPRGLPGDQFAQDVRPYANRGSVKAYEETPKEDN